MKKILVFVLLAAATIPTFSQANAYWYGRKKAKLTQYEITENENYMFPTWDAQNPVYDDTVTVTVTQYETYVTHDSISATSLLVLSPSSAVLPGAKVYLKPTGNNATARTLYVKQAAYVVDTVTCNTTGQFKTYVYDGTQFQPGYK